MKKLLLLLILIANTALGQADSSYVKRFDRSLSVLVGYDGIKRQFLEAGLAINRLKVIDEHHPLGTSVFISSEIMVDRNPTFGPKVGAWWGGGIGQPLFGANAIYYLNKDESSFRLRPEVGIGLSSFKLVYGYNFAITNRDFRRINTHNFSLVVLLKIKTLKNKASLL